MGLNLRILICAMLYIFSWELRPSDESHSKLAQSLNSIDETLKYVEPKFGRDNAPEKLIKEATETFSENELACLVKQALGKKPSKYHREVLKYITPALNNAFIVMILQTLLMS